MALQVYLPIKSQHETAFESIWLSFVMWTIIFNKEKQAVFMIG